MTQRDQERGHRRGPGHIEHPHDQHRYASREYEDLPSLTNRQWGPDLGDPQHSFGPADLGGYGDFRDRQPETGEYQRGQGGYAEDQGRHAQSGQGRGGSDFAASERLVSRGPAPAIPSQRGRGPRNYLRSDARIADDLIDRLTEDDQLDASEILVMVENGVVTLTGEIQHRWMKHRAEDIASQVSGVRDIDNRLLVDPGLGALGPPGTAIRAGHAQAGSAFASPPWTSALDDDASTLRGRGKREEP